MACETSGSHGSKYKHDSILRYCVMYILQGYKAHDTWLSFSWLLTFCDGNHAQCVNMSEQIMCFCSLAGVWHQWYRNQLSCLLCNSGYSRCGWMYHLFSQVLAGREFNRQASRKKFHKKHMYKFINSSRGHEDVST
jgi:hypothetical protein